MQWTLIGTNVPRSLALEDYVERRLVRRLSRFTGGIRRLVLRARDVDPADLSSDRELTAVVVLDDGQTIRMRQQSSCFYSAADDISDRLRHTIRRRLDRKLFNARRSYRKFKRRMKRSL